MKSNKIYKNLLLLFLFLLMFSSCQSEYTKLVNKELNSGVTHDSIFLDLKFGDTKSDFYQKCWELNKQKLAAQGPNNNYVQYAMPQKIDSNSGNYVNMLFYAKFNTFNKITAMDFKYYYAGWAPWNEKHHANVLMPSITDSILKWYPGNDFIEVNKKDSLKVLVKVDGNRQISIYPDKNTRDVSVLIEDLRIKIANKKD